MLRKALVEWAAVTSQDFLYQIPGASNDCFELILPKPIIIKISNVGNHIETVTLLQAVIPEWTWCDQFGQDVVRVIQDIARDANIHQWDIPATKQWLIERGLWKKPKSAPSTEGARAGSPRPRGRPRKIASSTQVLIREARSSSPQPCGRPRINTLSTQVSRVSGMTLPSTPQTVQVRNMEPPPIGETAGNPRPRGRPRKNTLVTKASILSGTTTSSALRLSQTVDDMELPDLTQQELPSPRSQNTDNPPPGLVSSTKKRHYSQQDTRYYPANAQGFKKAGSTCCH
jgi:hypothetical protein